jgi:hypothetical protein
MMCILNTLRIISVACFLSIFSVGSYAQTVTKVIVIPMMGDNAASNWLAAWTSSPPTPYKIGNIVQQGGSSYIATADHTSRLSDIPLDTSF